MKEIFEQLTTSQKQRYIHWLTENHRASQALLIYYPYRGIQISFAQNLIDYELCERPSNQSHCGQCRSCTWVASGDHPDYHFITLKKDQQMVGIDQIRALVERLTRKSQIHHRHIVMISHLDQLSISATNSLLKVLEEPPSSTVFYLLAQSEKNVIDTIKSRCFSLFLPYPSLSDLLSNSLEKSPSRNDRVHHWLSLFAIVSPGIVDQIESEVMLNKMVDSVEKWYTGRWPIELNDIFIFKEQVRLLMVLVQIYIKREIVFSANSEECLSESYHAAWDFYDLLVETSRLLSSGVVLNEDMIKLEILGLLKSLNLKNYFDITKVGDL